ncbi:MAG: hypothetical protein KY476_18880 [Planctomycetes bacterium]|nr:hypothetical protein [Planctomycetota bacterium]
MRIRTRSIVLVVVSLSAAAAAALYFLDEPLLSQLCREDGFVETMTAALYVLAAMLIVSSAHRGVHRAWIAGYVLLFAFVAGEEVSWGQRLLAVETPAVFHAVNVQDELNLHNIAGVHGNVRAAGLLVVLIIFAALPLGVRLLPRLRELAARWRHPVSPLWIAAVAGIAVAFMAVPRLGYGTTIFELDELGEFYLAVAFVLFSAQPRIFARSSVSSRTA